MLKITTQVNRGIIFIRLEGNLNSSTINTFYDELNYLLYKQGIHYYVLNFKNLDNIDQNIFTKFQNILTEIFLSCGQVVMCGVNKLQKRVIGTSKDKLFYVNEEQDAFKYLKI